MSRLVFSCVVLSASLALSKPWQGIHPGVSSAIDVFGKFGEPSSKKEINGQLVLVYSGLQAIPGTVQAQFKLAPGSQTIARIDVYPAPVIDKASVEKSYGRACNPKEATEPCYVRKESKNRTHYVYGKLGLAVFFKEDGSVQSLTFLPGT